MARLDLGIVQPTVMDVNIMRVIFFTLTHSGGEYCKIILLDTRTVEFTTIASTVD